MVRDAPHTNPLSQWENPQLKRDHLLSCFLSTQHGWHHNKSAQENKGARGGGGACGRESRRRTRHADQALSPGVSECRGCRAVSGGVELVSGQCRLTLVSEVSGSVGAGVGLVSGLLDSCRPRVVSRSVGVSGCRSVGVSGSVGECRGVRVSGDGECRRCRCGCYVSVVVLVALLHITLLGKHVHCQPACNTHYLLALHSSIPATFAEAT